MAEAPAISKLLAAPSMLLLSRPSLVECVFLLRSLACFTSWSRPALAFIVPASVAQGSDIVGVIDCSGRLP